LCGRRPSGGRGNPGKGRGEGAAGDSILSQQVASSGSTAAPTALFATAVLLLLPSLLLPQPPHQTRYYDSHHHHHHHRTVSCPASAATPLCLFLWSSSCCCFYIAAAMPPRHFLLLLPLSCSKALLSSTLPLLPLQHPLPPIQLSLFCSLGQHSCRLAKDRLSHFGLEHPGHLSREPKIMEFECIGLIDPYQLH
jgi:hypothetical protein